MPSTLYEEAIEAAEEIKIAAEEKVRQRLVESMTPQIKKLVEDNLFEKKKILNDEEINEEENTSECGTYEGIALEDDETTNSDDKKSLNLSDDSKKTLSALLSPSAEKKVVEDKISEVRQTKKVLEELIMLERNSLASSKKSEEITNLQEKLLKEVENIGSNSIFKKDNDLLSEYIEISKEIKTMSRRRNNYLNEDIEQLLEMDLLEADDPEMEDESDELGSLLDAEGLDSDEMNTEMDMDMDMDMDLPDGRGEEELMDLLTNAKESIEGAMDAAEQMMGEGGDDSEGMDSEGMDSEGMDSPMEEEDDLIEIDENVLKAEIARMRNARQISESDRPSKAKNDASKKPKISDIDNNSPSEDDSESDSKKVKNEAAKLTRENRMLESKLDDYRKAMDNLQNQLNEMNLFNAKLLYANKLMQNKNLSNNQQKKIVESLDEAKTINEAKLLFESLSKSLTKTKPNRSLNESSSRRVLSSGSKAVGSAQPKGTSNVALNRWALLAGIKQ